MEIQETHPRDGGEMTFAEIAEVLGITPGGAWMAYNSAMKKLRHPRNRQALSGFKISRTPNQPEDKK